MSPLEPDYSGPERRKSSQRVGVGRRVLPDRRGADSPAPRAASAVLTERREVPGRRVHKRRQLPDRRVRPWSYGEGAGEES